MSHLKNAAKIIEDLKMMALCTQYSGWQVKRQGSGGFAASDGKGRSIFSFNLTNIETFIKTGKI